MVFGAGVKIPRLFRTVSTHRTSFVSWSDIIKTAPCLGRPHKSAIALQHHNALMLPHLSRLQPGGSVPRYSLRGRSGARHPRHARAKEAPQSPALPGVRRAVRDCGWLRSSHPLRSVPWLADVRSGRESRLASRTRKLGKKGKTSDAAAPRHNVITL